MGKKWNALRETKDEKADDEKTKVEPRGAAESAHEADDTFRTFGTQLRFWKFCRERRCKRAQGCRGDNAEACFMNFWREVPGDIKAQIRIALKLRLAGASPAEAVRGAREELARWKKMEADRAAKFAAPSVTRRQFPPPRVRQM